VKKILSIILLFASITIFAEEKSSGERMMITMGVDKILQAQREAYKADAVKQVAMLMKQLEGTLSGLPKETSQEIEKAMTLMMGQVLDSWDVETAIKVYSEEWNKNYTQLEIEGFIKKYESPSAKKEIQVVMAASTALNQYISTSYNSALEKSMAEFLSKIQQAIVKGKQEAQSNKSNQPTAKAAAD
jgi:hypothetical protein